MDVDMATTLVFMKLAIFGKQGGEKWSTINHGISLVHLGSFFDLYWSNFWPNSTNPLVDIFLVKILTNLLVENPPKPLSSSYRNWLKFWPMEVKILTNKGRKKFTHWWKFWPKKVEKNCSLVEILTNKGRKKFRHWWIFWPMKVEILTNKGRKNLGVGGNFDQQR